MFGDRAIHLDYPNAFDMDQSRNGNGIFLHGTNQSLQPRSSNGCISMRNEDIALVGELIQEQVTPIIIVENLSLPDLNQRIKACNWIDGINIEKMAAAPARMGQGLGLLNPPAGFHYSKQSALDAIGDKLWGFTTQANSNSVRTTGVSIFGLGTQWVLAANQVMQVGKQDYNLVKRLYMEGSDPKEAALLRTSWVLDHQAQAQALAALAPALPSRVLAANDAVVPPSTTIPSEVQLGQQTAAANMSPEEQLQQLLKNWLFAWSSKNIKSYMAFYAPEFMSAQGQNFHAWKSHKTSLFRTYKNIVVIASNIDINVTGFNAVITFKQNYRSDWHQDVGYKTLKLKLTDAGQWLIVNESWQEQP
jgi:hypothetical protein